MCYTRRERAGVCYFAILLRVMLKGVGEVGRFTPAEECKKINVNKTIMRRNTRVKGDNMRREDTVRQ